MIEHIIYYIILWYNVIKCSQTKKVTCYLMYLNVTYTNVSWILTQQFQWSKSRLEIWGNKYTRISHCPNTCKCMQILLNSFRLFNTFHIFSYLFNYFILFSWIFTPYQSISTPLNSFESPSQTISINFYNFSFSPCNVTWTIGSQPHIISYLFGLGKTCKNNGNWWKLNEIEWTRWKDEHDEQLHCLGLAFFCRFRCIS